MEDNSKFEVTLKCDISPESRTAFNKMSREDLQMLAQKASMEISHRDDEIKWLEKIIDQFSDKESYIDLGLPSKTLWADRNYGANDEFSSSFPQMWQNIRFEDTSTFPSSEDYQELIDNTDHKFVANYKKSGACGMVFKSRANGNEIFLPACGLYNRITETTDHKLSGHYYTKTPCEKTHARYNTLYFNSSMIGAYVDISKNNNSQLRTIIKNG